MDVSKFPQYKSHKTVRAIKIANLHVDGDRIIITPDDPGVEAFSVMAAEWVNKPTLHIGGYFVVYRDGYTSWSPASEFEDGYSPIREDV